MRSATGAGSESGVARRLLVWTRYPALPYTLIAVGVTAFQLSRMVTSNRLGLAAFAQDDAYYYFRIAQNIAAGDGSTWDGLHRTNGYHPLWLIALLPWFVVLRGRVAGMVVPKVLAGVLWIVDMVLVRQIARLVGAERTLWIGVLPSAAIAAYALRSPPFNGVETPILLACLLLATRLLLGTGLLSGDEPGGTSSMRQVWLTGGALALVVLSRLDAVSVAALFGVAVLVRMVQRRRRIGEIVRVGVALAAPTALALSAYMAVNQALFGSPIPVSGRAKTIPDPRGGWPEMRVYFREGLGLPDPFGPGLAATLIVALVFGSLWLARPRDGTGDPARRRMTELGMILALAWAGGMLLVAYYDRTTSWKLLAWYYYAATFVLLLGPGVVIANVIAWWETRGHRLRILDRLAASTRPAVGIAAIGLVLVLAVGAGFAKRVEARGDENFFVQSAAIARRLNHELPRDAVLGMGDRAGIFGYELDRPVVSIEGIVNNADYLHALEDGKVHRFLEGSSVDHYVRSINTAEEASTTAERDQGGTWAPPASCGRRAEPLYGTGPKTWFRVCADDVVFTTDPSATETLTVWRYPPRSGREASGAGGP
jgi:hypothetical protein